LFLEQEPCICRPDGFERVTVLKAHFQVWSTIGDLMKSILNDHSRRYPYWALDDLYKLIHQASMGSEHYLEDEAAVRDWLLTELKQLRPGPHEPLVDPISPDGKIVRVHLRPFSDLDIDAEPLLQAFILTGKRIIGSTDLLLKYAEQAESLAENGDLPFSSEKIRRYINRLGASGFPAVHHSERYVEEYRPTYRVVAFDLLPEGILAIT
jgi:hypothetical protein